MKLKLDSPGIREVLRSAAVAGAIGAAADGVASSITATAHGGEPVEVQVGAYTTDRAAVAVTLAHAAGVGIEAKHGVLARAAAAAGLEVRSRA